MAGSGWNPNPDEALPSALRSPSDETPTGIRHIVIVEDNEADVFLIREAIETTKLPVLLHIVRDGEQAVRFFDRVDASPATPCPDLVLLDISLPRKLGSAVLQHIRNSRRSRGVLVIAISTSKSAQDRAEMMKLGANGFFPKPSEYEDFMRLGDIVKNLLTPQ